MSEKIDYENAVVTAMKHMTEAQKKNILDFVAAQTVSRPKSVDGKTFIERTRHIRISQQDANEMMSAIDAAFSDIDDIEIDFDG